MNKKILKVIGILTIILVLFSVFTILIFKPPITNTKKFVEQRFSQFEAQSDGTNVLGYDVTEAEAFAKKAFDSKDYSTANELLDRAFEAWGERMFIAPLVPSGWINEGIIYEAHPYYYDGTFNAITKQIPTLADLGVKTIWLMPIWEHDPLPPEGNKFRYGFVYHILDYYKISSEFGTEDELKELVDTAHKHNIKVIFELVTCCTFEGSTIYNNNWTLYVSVSKLHEMGFPLKYATINGVDYAYSNCTEDERYGILRCDLFGRIDDDNVSLLIYPYYMFGYAVDRTNPEVIDYFTKVAEYYMDEYDIDGWRIDAPADNWNPEVMSGDYSSVRLLASAKEAITKIKPHAIFLSEFSACNSLPEDFLETPLPDPVFDKMCEASNSYYFRDELMKSLKEINSEKLINIIADEKTWYNRTRTRNIELHGQQRINKLAPQLNKPILVLISTIPGIPQIQAGQEIGAVNPFLSDAPVDWTNGDYELREFYKKVFKIRNNNNALKYGSMENVLKSGDNTCAFLREYEDEKVIVVINFKGRTVSNTIDLPFEGGVTLYDALNNERFVVNNPNNFKITLSAHGSRILVLEDGGE